jgi:hypothetical protein
VDDLGARVDDAKRARWRRGRGPHYEVWYTTVSQLTSGAGFWIRYALLEPRRAPPRVEVWFASFVPDQASACVAAVQEYPIDQLAYRDNPFTVRIGPCTLESGRMTGMLEAAGTPVTWDLVYTPVTEPLEPLPEAFYRAGWVGTKLVVPHPFLLAGGKIEIGGRTFILNGDPGEHGHVWGRRHAAEWLWFHASAFVEEGGEPIPGYVTGVAARQQLGGVLLPPLSFGHLVWREKHVALRPATPWQERDGGAWRWTGTRGDEDVAVSVSFRWPELLLAEYEDPGGARVFCHHTERGDCRVEFRAPRRPPTVFQAAGTAHLEIGSRRADPRAGRRVVRQR